MILPAGSVCGFPACKKAQCLSARKNEVETSAEAIALAGACFSLVHPRLAATSLSVCINLKNTFKGHL